MLIIAKVLAYHEAVLREFQHVGVIFGGPSPEHDVSVLTGLQALRALASARWAREVSGVYWSRTGEFFRVGHGHEGQDFLSGPPPGADQLQLLVGPGGGFKSEKGRFGRAAQGLDLEVALVCCHGGPGEDGALQGVLDLCGLAYSGPSAAGAALGMDKLAQGAVISGAGIPTLPRVALTAEAPAPAFGPPYIVKPRFGGSSIGIAVVADFETAKALLASSVHLRRGAIIEPYRADLFDLQIALRTWPGVVLSAIERPIRQKNDKEILDYADKYVGGQGMDAAARELPAAIDAALAEQIREITRQSVTLLNARGVNRVDFLSDGTNLFLNEINTIPGSLSRHLFVEPLTSFEELLNGLLCEAVERPAAQFSSAGSDGRILRDAKAIAAKLA
jgi:D-alanine-D-alanine ligase